jgi:hypothetical protein
MMLDHILATARAFESLHGITPNVIYINPYHYGELRRHCPGLFAPEHGVHPGLRFIILPRSQLPHPKAAMLPAFRPHCRAA